MISGFCSEPYKVLGDFRDGLKKTPLMRSAGCVLKERSTHPVGFSLAGPGRLLSPAYS